MIKTDESQKAAVGDLVGFEYDQGIGAFTGVIEMVLRHIGNGQSFARIAVIECVGAVVDVPLTRVLILTRAYAAPGGDDVMGRV